jgi:hypothetical protein
VGTEMTQEEEEENYIRIFAISPFFTKKGMGKACNMYVGNWDCIKNLVTI